MPDDAGTRWKRSSQGLSELPVYRKHGTEEQEVKGTSAMQDVSRDNGEGNDTGALDEGDLTCSGRRQMSGCWLGGAPGGVTTGTGDGVMGEVRTGTVVRVSPAYRPAYPSQGLAKCTLNTSSLLYVNYALIKLF